MSGLFQDEPPPAADTAPPQDGPPQAGPGLFGDTLPAPAPASAPAYRVLARKYRPQRFDDLIGQEAMVRILRRAFALGRVAHAFMLTGVRGVGKTTTARIIARAFNCVGPDGQGGPTPDPCGVCPNCVAILADRHPDVVEMDAASNTGVDDVREIIEATRFRPMQARTKVFIVDEVHMLSRNAFNALLKTLEEPPPHVKFIFATTEIRKVPVTVLSRCQRFDLRRVSAAELSVHFARIAAAEGIAIEAEAVALIARAADGSVRDGLSLLDQAIAQGTEAGGGTIDAARVADMLGLADRGALFDLFEALMAGQPAAALAITDRAHERGADLGVLIADLLDLVHTLTRLKSVPGLRDGGELPEAERTRGAALADRLSVPVLGRLWQMLLKGVAEVESAPDRRAAAEMVLIRLCHVADLPPPGELVRRLSAAPGGAPVSIPPGGGGGRRRRAGRGRRRPGPCRRPAGAAPCSGRTAARRPARRGDAGAGAAGGAAGGAAAAFGASRPLRAAGDRAASGGGRAARPRIPARRPAAGCDRHPLDDRALDRARRADAGRAGRGSGGGAARGCGAAPAGARDPRRLSRRADRNDRGSGGRVARHGAPDGAPDGARHAGVCAAGCRAGRCRTGGGRRDRSAGQGVAAMKNLAGLMKQAGAMQAKMQELQAKLETIEIEGSAGAGLVQLAISGKGEMKRLTIDPKLLDPAEVEMLQDLVVAAHADARRKLETVTAEEMQKVAGGLNLPPGMSLPF